MKTADRSPLRLRVEEKSSFLFDFFLPIKKEKTDVLPNSSSQTTLNILEFGKAFEKLERLVENCNELKIIHEYQPIFNYINNIRELSWMSHNASF